MGVVTDRGVRWVWSLTGVACGVVTDRGVTSGCDH